MAEQSGRLIPQLWSNGYYASAEYICNNYPIVKWCWVTLYTRSKSDAYNIYNMTFPTAYGVNLHYRKGPIGAAVPGPILTDITYKNGY